MKSRGGVRATGSLARKFHPSQTVQTIYRELSRAWGPQHWWPAESPFEVIVGAILTQNTSWRNVERALANLRAANAMSLAGIRTLPLSELEQLVRPSGYFRQKAARLKGFVAFVDERYGGSLDPMLGRATAVLREELLAQKGIGPETADSILLYAAQHPIFVVDAYTRRILERHEAISDEATYDAVRGSIESALQNEELKQPATGRTSPTAPQAHLPSAMSMAARSALAQVYNDMHGLLVQLGKHHCLKAQPKCELCPLSAILPPPRIAESSGTRRTRARGRLGKSLEPRL
jgi:endonuclease III related protein